MNEPITSAEQYLDSLAGEESDLPEPVSRLEMFLAALAGEDVTLPEPESRAERYLKEIIDNGGGGGDISLIELAANANGVYTPGTGKAYKKVTVSVLLTLQNKTVTENGAVTADQGYDGLGTVTVNVSGGTPTLTQAQWDALTTAQKQAYGLVGIIKSATGFERGDLVNGGDYVDIGRYLPSSDKDNIICEATIDDFDAGSTRWGLGDQPVTLTETVTMSDGAVYIPVKSRGVTASVSLGMASTPFTAYVVMKGSQVGQFSRLVACTAARGAGSTIMLYGSPVAVSSWGSDTQNDKNYSAEDYFVGVIQFSAHGASLGKVNDSSFIAKASNYSGAYVVLGQTDLNPSGSNAEPTDIYVKYVGVVAEAESRATISENVSHLMDAFGITPNA